VNQPRVHALIPAAGQSVRFGGTTVKQYTHLLGQPVMAHSIQAVLKHPSVTQVTVVLAPDDGIYNELIRPVFPEVTTVEGGETRSQSVMNGLRFIMEADPDCEWVLVHDAARPCLSAAALHDLIELGLTSMAGAILAIPVSDTLKVANESGYINKTVDRSCYWSAQTPQLFRIHQLAANMESALSQGEQPTDEAAAMEAAGVHPLLVQGVASNIKITGPDDMAMAEFVLQRQAVAE
jgi:2-C-methyl-D-erythritol 4-phosphate cytidylyltransferase